MWELPHSTSALTLWNRVREGPLPVDQPQALQDGLKLHQKILKAVDAVHNAIRLIGPQRLAVSFNGGKDAVVVLHLTRIALVEHYMKNKVPRERWKAPIIVFFHSLDEFSEVDSFVLETARTYGLNLRIYQGSYTVAVGECIREFADGASLEAIKNGDTSPAGFVLGLRQGDPNSEDQSTYELGSFWLPAFLRVHPILRWTYGDVWDFLRSYELPYCSLYDEGYTSIGRKSITSPNPLLRQPSGSYSPARQLKNWAAERLGRANRVDEDSPPLSASTSIMSAMSTQGTSQAPTGTISVASEKLEVSDFLGDQILETLQVSIQAEARETELCAEEPTSSVVEFTQDNCRTAGVIVIGDEILRAGVRDTNSALILEALRERGLSVIRCVVIRDDVQQIKDEVILQLGQCDVIITTGGIGPTHDDVTLQAIAEALGQPLHVDNVMVKFLCRKWDKETLTGAELNFATLPTGTCLHWIDDNNWPVFQTGRVFILPGVPQFCKRGLTLICETLLPKRNTFSREIDVPFEERRFAESLTQETQTGGCVKVGR